jgi:hypothetical protein
MASKKSPSASAKPNQTFWTPKHCAGCGKLIETMKEANRLLVKDFVGAKANTKFLWRHKLCV